MNVAVCKQAQSTVAEEEPMEPHTGIEFEQRKPSERSEHDYSPRQWVSHINRAFLLCREVLIYASFDNKYGVSQQ